VLGPFSSTIAIESTECDPCPLGKYSKLTQMNRLLHC
jgi:hypothetical protein